MDIRPTGHGRDHIIVAVRGEIDLATADELQTSLQTALSAVGVAGISLDLSQVTFLDCSALRALLAVEQHATRRGLTVSLTAASAPVRRLLSLAGFPAGSTFLAEPVGTPARVRGGGRRRHHALDSPAFRDPTARRALTDRGNGNRPVLARPAPAPVGVPAPVHREILTVR